MRKTATVGKDVEVRGNGGDGVEVRGDGDEGSGS